MATDASTDGRLSTCGICGGTIKWSPMLGAWQHVAETTRTADGHWPQADDSHVSGPDRKDCCEAFEDDDCDPECDCDDCEDERALDEDADAHAGRMED